MKPRLFSIITLCSVMLSCSFFKSTDDRIPVARVNDVYLYEKDIENILPSNVSKQDSTIIAEDYINRWARRLLLMDGALVNLPDYKQEEFQKLVEQYKNDLYTKAYLEGLVKKNIDTIVNTEDAKYFYEANKESFKLNDELLMFRYINLAQNSIDLDGIEERFKRFDYNDKVYLDSISIQFKSYSLNDSIWIKASQVTNKIPAITPENKNQLLKKSNFIQLQDSLNLYLIQVKDVLLQNDYAPLEYIMPSINQIVINKRKLELIKQLENDITKDAIKNNEFEIFN